jgi:hypothetical protein
MKFPTIENMSELRKIEASIGFTSGILVGAIASAVTVLFFVDMAWYFKTFTGIGSLGIVGMLYMALSELIKSRRNLIKALDMMKDINTESNKIIEEKTK